MILNRATSTSSALYSRSSFAAMMFTMFRSVAAVWLAASTWTWIPQELLTVAPDALSFRTISWTVSMSRYWQMGETSSTAYFWFTRPDEASTRIDESLTTFHCRLSLSRTE